MEIRPQIPKSAQSDPNRFMPNTIKHQMESHKLRLNMKLEDRTLEFEQDQSSDSNNEKIQN